MTQSELAEKIAARVLEADLISEVEQQALAAGLATDHFTASDWARLLSSSASSTDPTDPTASTTDV